MHNQEILEKAIQKAIDGGWSKIYANNWREIFEQDGNLKDYLVGALIFNHGFAKALWEPKLIGEVSATYALPSMGGIVKTNHMLPIWQYYLQQMVIAEDPIKYLGENI